MNAVLDEHTAARVRRKAGIVWAFRARAELDARAQFARLAETLANAGAASEIVGMATTAAADEARHAVLCERLAGHFGATVTQTADPASNAIGPAGLGRRERALYASTAISCVTETLSAAVLGELRDRAEDPLVRNTLSEILRDEVQHGRLGWAHLAAESAQGLPTAFLSEHVPAMLAVTVNEELFLPTDVDLITQEEEEGLAAHGALGRHARRELFVSVMRGVVFPGLARFGVDPAPGERWLDERLARAELSTAR